MTTRAHQPTFQLWPPESSACCLPAGIPRQMVGRLLNVSVPKETVTAAASFRCLRRTLGEAPPIAAKVGQRILSIVLSSSAMISAQE